MENGTIVGLKLEKGFGFIKPTGGGKDLFFHANQLADGIPFDQRLTEMRVQYNVVETNKGPRAVDVQPAK